MLLGFTVLKSNRSKLNALTDFSTDYSTVDKSRRSKGQLSTLRSDRGSEDPRLERVDSRRFVGNRQQRIRNSSCASPFTRYADYVWPDRFIKRFIDPSIYKVADLPPVHYCIRHVEGG